MDAPDVNNCKSTIRVISAGGCLPVFVHPPEPVQPQVHELCDQRRLLLACDLLLHSQRPQPSHMTLTVLI